MQLLKRVLISLVIAALAWAALYFIPAIPPVAAVFAVAILTALLSGTSAVPSPRTSSISSTGSDSPVAISGPREEGSVKWFNVSKGFGFITKDNGEEIFVHFRSIRGDGHRSLKDGQRVSFVEAETDKGPQAEDVIGL